MISAVPKTSRRLRDKAIRISLLLRELYGSPNHNNKTDPLDELIFIILSQMTTSPSFERVYDSLKQRVPQWHSLLTMQDRHLKALIKDAGLSNQKAPRIKAIAHRLAEDFGNVTLDALRKWHTPRAEAYLKGLPGVDTKTAKCVLMYSLNRKVLPIDTHVYRVAVRLGILSSHIPRPAIHSELEAVVPAHLRYGFHVNAIAHGRKLCRAVDPRCEACQLRSLCKFYREGHLVGAETPEG